MEYIKLGNSDLKVSRLCLGCMSFGEADQGQYQWTLDYESSKKIIDKAYDCGINFFDTSNNYSNGTSEIFLGKAIKDYRREDIVITTKCYFNEGKLSAKAIHREVQGSLKRLDTDYIDILVLHRFDYDTPIEETLAALDEEVKAGRILRRQCDVCLPVCQILLYRRFLWLSTFRHLAEPLQSDLSGRRKRSDPDRRTVWRIQDILCPLCRRKTFQKKLGK